MITLELPSAELRRHLTIRLEGPHLTARIADGHRTLVFACDKATNCRLGMSPPYLWIGSVVSFDLTAAEAERVRDVFGPHGLRVTEK